MPSTALGVRQLLVNPKGVELPPCPHLIILILQGGGLRVQVPVGGRGWGERSVLLSRH